MAVGRSARFAVAGTLLALVLLALSADVVHCQRRRGSAADTGQAVSVDAGDEGASASASATGTTSASASSMAVSGEDGSSASAETEADDETVGVSVTTTPSDEVQSMAGGADNTTEDTTASGSAGGDNDDKDGASISVASATLLACSLLSAILVLA